MSPTMQNRGALTSHTGPHTGPASGGGYGTPWRAGVVQIGDAPERSGRLLRSTQPRVTPPLPRRSHGGRGQGGGRRRGPRGQWCGGRCGGAACSRRGGVRLGGKPSRAASSRAVPAPTRGACCRRRARARFPSQLRPLPLPRLRPALPLTSRALPLLLPLPRLPLPLPLPLLPLCLPLPLPRLPPGCTLQLRVQRLGGDPGGPAARARRRRGGPEGLQPGLPHHLHARRLQQEVVGLNGRRGVRVSGGVEGADGRERGIVPPEHRSWSPPPFPSPPHVPLFPSRLNPSGAALPRPRPAPHRQQGSGLPNLGV